MTEQWEPVGRLVDRLDSLITAMTMPIPDSIHLGALRESLPEIRDELHKAFVDATGDDPWSDHPPLPR